MKNSIRSLVAVLALGACALASRAAEPAVKILVVDIAKLYDSHYKTAEQTAKLEADKRQAEEMVEKMNKEGNALVDEYKNLQEQSQNAALTPEAKAKAQNDAQKKLDEIQAKRNDINNFVQQTSQTLNNRLKSFQNVLIEEITKVATDIAKRKGATLLLDKSGPSMIGISNLVYSDAGFEITDDVAKEINKDRPASAPTAPAAGASSLGAPSSSAPAPASGPTINLPIAPTKK